MKIEEAIAILERKTTIPGDGYTWEQIEQAIDTAITALRSMPETGEPLTLEQLQEMDGKPVYLKIFDEEFPSKSPAIIIAVGDIYITFIRKVMPYIVSKSCKNYGETWLAYSYQSIHIDRSKWEGCKHCEKACWNCAHNLLCCGENDEECNDCVNQSKWEFIAHQNYCPKCGRPLTEEAWTELERRLKGESPRKSF